ncbi:MAG: 2-amino-4-hydroxy-6-hydroxymethyldihydropteridine diphosphokinase [Deltaproteobacteria bacterium]|nr:2-amino-4-hydroxy-6-hydroxymethyldihydropteridine diphosphokinase [Deltaproteobacteria bacterium]
MTALLAGAIALGANLGEPRRTLAGTRRSVGARLQRWGCQDLSWSRLWRTQPVGPPQPAYLNAAVTFAAPASLDAALLLAFLLDEERAYGRVRLERWGPRTLDLDLLYLGETRLQTLDLTLPHPRAHERAFVLWPLLDADPGAVLPGHGAVAPLARALGQTGVEPLTAVGEPW